MDGLYKETCFLSPKLCIGSYCLILFVNIIVHIKFVAPIVSFQRVAINWLMMGIYEVWEEHFLVDLRKATMIFSCINSYLTLFKIREENMLFAHYNYDVLISWFCILTETFI